MQPLARFKTQRIHGFTLAELLVALLILGLIATFTIPKILSSQADARKKAIFKETIATLSEITYLYCMQPDTSVTLFAYYASRMNTVKQCPTNAVTQGCDVANTEPGYTLHNGVHMAGFRNTMDRADGISIDINGVAGPNLIGDDRLDLVVNIEPPLIWWGVGPCRVAPAPSDAQSVAYYQQLFQ